MNSIPKPINLKKIILEYEDGRQLIVTETKDLAVGSAFMGIVGKHQMSWKLHKRFSLIDYIAKLFSL